MPQSSEEITKRNSTKRGKKPLQMFDCQEFYKAEGNLWLKILFGSNLPLRRDKLTPSGLQQNFVSPLVPLFFNLFNWKQIQNLQENNSKCCTVVKCSCLMRGAFLPSKYFKKKKCHIRTEDRGVPFVVQQEWIWLGTLRLQVRSLASISGLRIQSCCELWCRLQTWFGSWVATAVV